MFKSTIVHSRHSGGIFLFLGNYPGSRISRSFTREGAAISSHRPWRFDSPLGTHTSTKQSAKADCAAGTYPEQSAKADSAAGTSAKQSAKTNCAAGTSAKQSGKVFGLSAPGKKRFLITRGSAFPARALCRIRADFARKVCAFYRVAFFAPRSDECVAAEKRAAAAGGQSRRAREAHP